MLSLKLKWDTSALNESRIKSPKQMADYSDSPKEAKYGLSWDQSKYGLRRQSSGFGFND